MPLPSEILEEIKKGVDDAEARVKSIKDIISDLRASGIDASKQEEELKVVEDNLRKLRLFYGRQAKRAEGKAVE